MDPLTDNNFLLTLGTFLPLVGVVVMMFISDAEETFHKQIAIVTSGATLAVGVWTLLAFDYGNSATLQFWVDEEWISVIRSFDSQIDRWASGFNSPSGWPSTLTSALVLSRSSSVTSMRWLDGMTTGRSLSVCGQIGTTTTASSFGAIMGPAQLKA